MCVLVVDDEPLIVMVLEDVLTDAGFDVMTSSNASGAVSLLAEYLGYFSALVTDFHMPG